MLPPLARPALAGVAFFAVVCAALIALWVFMPKGEVKWYPSLWMRLAAISPLFFSGRLAPLVYKTLRMRMSGHDRLVFAAIFGAGVGLVAVITEAAIVTVTFSEAEPLTFLEVLFAPLSSRYTLGIFAGIGFASSAVLAAGFVGLMSVPIRVLSFEQHSKTGDGT